MSVCLSVSVCLLTVCLSVCFPPLCTVYRVLASWITRELKATDLRKNPVSSKTNEFALIILTRGTCVVRSHFKLVAVAVCRETHFKLLCLVVRDFCVFIRVSDTARLPSMVDLLYSFSSLLPLTYVLVV